MWHKPCRTFHPWCLCIKTRCLFTSILGNSDMISCSNVRLLHGLIDRIKTSHSFKHGYNTGDGVVLYALVSPQWPHACFADECNTIPRHVVDLSGAACSVWNFCDNARFWKLGIKSGASVVILGVSVGEGGPKGLGGWACFNAPFSLLNLRSPKH